MKVRLNKTQYFNCDCKTKVLRKGTICKVIDVMGNMLELKTPVGHKIFMQNEVTVIK